VVYHVVAVAGRRSPRVPANIGPMVGIDRATFLRGLLAVMIPNGKRPAEKPVTIDPTRPVRWKLRVLDGPDFHLEDHRGKVVVTTFFATWCPPCNDEQPMLVEFAQAHPDDTVVVGIDSMELDNTVRAYRKRYNIPYTIAMDETGGYQQAIAPGGGDPTTLVFDVGGYLSAWWYGSADRERLEGARAAALVGHAPEPEPTPVEPASPQPPR
jgi:thiol-disulfide isomerase/thioredoxin